LKEDSIGTLAVEYIYHVTVLVDHAPLVTPLTSGEISLKLPDNTEKKFSITSGFFEVSDNQALILAEKISED